MPRLDDKQRKVLIALLKEVRGNEGDVVREILKLIDSTDNEIAMRLKLYAGEKATELAETLPAFDKRKLEIEKDLKDYETIRDA